MTPSQSPTFRLLNNNFPFACFTNTLEFDRFQCCPYSDAMQMCRTFHFHRRIVGSLIVVWLLLGGLALAEQLNVVPETNASDEQALTQLQFAVKSDTLNASIDASFLHLLPLAVTVSLSTAGTSVPSNSINAFADLTYTRSLPRFTCCYRL